MGPFPFILGAIVAIWIAFEIWLIIRDRIHGKGKPARDKGTLYFNFIAIILGLTIAGFLNGNSAYFFPGGRTYSGFWIGIAIMIAGFALRFWAVAALGGSFRTTVETHPNQAVVDNGPYKRIRHPSYTGLLLLCVGDGIALQNWLSLAAAIVLPLVALLYRIHVEEGMLLSSMGEEYQDYQRRTKKLIPWIW
jgi:protein-S-isoprenylcysteine O-methyltransferase Ste14